MLIGSTKYLQHPPFNDLHELRHVCNTNGEWDPMTTIPGYKDPNNLLSVMDIGYMSHILLIHSFLQEPLIWKVSITLLTFLHILLYHVPLLKRKNSLLYLLHFS